MSYPPQGGYGQQPGYGYPQTPPSYGHQQPTPQPGYPQYPDAGSTGWLRIDAKFFWMAWVLFFVKPVIIVNGQQMPNTQWGLNTLTLPAGTHHVLMYFPWLFPAQPGRVEQWITVHPGQATDVEYRAPIWVFSPGSLGPAPQPYNGLGLMIAIYAVFILVFLAMCLGMINASSRPYYY
ncbi:hypothetical protein [Stackebrandtia soli]|uniref:hypothetical protein n=1 Tax=Stackebrandtia soli TaxID=1892856 RepID=UPI0039EC32AF